ncbi:MAG: hypothetical protein SGPRY_011356, partial [Prymnesium sp.]
MPPSLQPTTHERPVSLRRLVRATLVHPVLLLLGTCFLVGGAYVELSLTRGVGQLLDLLSSSPEQTDLVDTAFFRIGIQVLCVAVLRHAGEMLLRVAGERAAFRLRTALFRSLLARELSFFDQSPTGALGSMLSHDTEAVQQAVSTHLPNLCRYGCTAAISACWMASISSRLTLLGLLAGPLIGLIASAFGGRLQHLVRQQQLQLSAAHAVAAEGLSCIRSIKAFGRHALVSHAFEVEAERACSLSLREYALHKCWNASNLLMAAAATCLVVREGSRRVFLGELSPGDLVAFAAFGVSTGQAANDAANHWSSLSSRQDEKLHRGVSEGQLASSDGLSVEFVDVRFSYRLAKGVDTSVALDGLSFRAESGKSTALVGTSGSGKSTIFNLLLRLYRPSDGRIAIGGVALESIPDEQLRDLMAIVPQEPALFRGTFRQNIAFGAPLAADSEWSSERMERELIGAARRANIHEFILEAGGYDSMVGERGE